MTETDRGDPLFTDRTFDELDLPEPIQRAVDDLGFTHLTRVQADVLPLSMDGRDVVAQAQTGSGKTAAYLLTIFSHILRTPRPSPPETPRALIVAPTRELAVQIAGDAEALGHHAGIRNHVVFGGLDYRKQREILERGTDLLIGTPGRLIDYHKKGSYSLRQTEMVIIDECDRLFDMGFSEDLRWILRRTPHPKDRQSMMFTATLSQRVMTLGWRQMNNPAEIIVSAEQLTPDTIQQVLYHVATREKLSLLLGVLEREGSSRTMIFVNTRYRAQRLVDDLRRHGYVARGLTGNVVQTKRLRVLDDFRDGKLPILVATDVASRGLHIEGVSHVINYDLPQDAEDYVHRIGRTARAGAAGQAVSLACEEYVYSLPEIEQYIGQLIPTAPIKDDFLVTPAPPEPRRPSEKPGGHGRNARSRRGGGQRGPSNRNSDTRAQTAETGTANAAPAATGDDAAAPTRPKRRRRPRRKPEPSTPSK
jgi:ATP-dependent RNA helicase RhlB